MKIVGYCRVSSSEQADNGASLANQEATIREWADREGHEVVGVWSEDVSGKIHHDKRPGLSAALDALPSGGMLVVLRRDRLYRQYALAGLLHAELERRGCKVHSLAGEDADDPLIRAIHDGVAERMRWDVGNKTREVLHRKRKNGERTGGVPYGWEPDPESPKQRNRDGSEKIGKDGRPLYLRLRPSPTEQKTLRLMKRLRGEGKGWRKIASELSRRGVVAKLGGRWLPSSVKAVLTREVA